MKFSAKVIMALFAGAFAVTAAAQDLSGVWQHTDLSAWMEIRFEQGVGTGTVVRNDEYPDRVGRVLLKEISADGAIFRGQVFAQRFEEYRDAEISLPQPGQMQIKVKVGFMSRVVEWTRVAAVPANE